MADNKEVLMDVNGNMVLGDMSSSKELKVSICVAVKEKEMGVSLVDLLAPIPVNVIIGNAPSFSKMINEIIYSSRTTDIFIFCSHRVRPTKEDIYRMIAKINEGYGLVAFYRLACFGFKMDLIRKVGFFDERFIPAGYEDDDFFFRLQEADIAMYEDKSVEYIPGPSLWQQELYTFEGVPYKQPITYKYFIKKWERDHYSYTIKRRVSEQQMCYNMEYNINDDESKKVSTVFKKWGESHLFPDNLQKVYNVVNNLGIENKRILIFGGTGSLGQKFITMNSSNGNKMYVVSRDENKHWLLSQKNEFKDVSFIIGDIRDYERVTETIAMVNPHIIIIAAAMKHIDRCEYDVNEAFLTNTTGVMNVCKSVFTNEVRFKKLECVVYVSTDKATKPINTYGMTKALSEKIMIEYSKKMFSSSIKFMTTRYGNILNSRGSIIPKLQESTADVFTLTHPDMTRFIMTQEQAIHLIEYAILNGLSGETIIPKLTSMKIEDIFNIFAELKNKTIKITAIRPGEKIHEELLNEDELRRTFMRDDYYILPPSYEKNDNVKVISPETFKNNSYSSCDNIISKEELKNYLIETGFLSGVPPPRGGSLSLNCVQTK